MEIRTNDIHIDDRRLFEVSLNNAALTVEERDHVRHCDDCRELMRIFARQRLNNRERELLNRKAS